MKTRHCFLDLLLAALLLNPLLGHAEGEQWEYFVAKSLDDLNKPMKDPTNECKEGISLSVLGRQGWELISVYADSRREEGTAKGTILLQPERPGNTRQGTFQFGVQTSERVTAIFKRPLSHPLRGKVC